MIITNLFFIFSCFAHFSFNKAHNNNTNIEFKLNKLFEMIQRQHHEQELKLGKQTYWQ